MNFNDRDISKVIEDSLKNVDHSVLDAQVLMYRFLSEVEKITDEKNISRRQLAKLLGTSPSYITQLFRGNKIMSLEFLGRIQRALNIEFKISVVPANHQVADAFSLEGTAPKDLPKQRYTSVKKSYDLPSTQI